MLKNILFPVLALAACSVPAVLPVYAQEEATVQTAVSVEAQMKAALEKTNALIVLLESLESLEDASAVAPKVKILWEELEEITAGVEAKLGPEGVSQLAEDYPELVDSEMHLSRILAELDYKHSWFGCKELEGIFMLTDGEEPEITSEEPVLTPELKQVYGNAAESILAAITQIRKILDTVQDKESADAAAPLVAGILSQARKIWEDVDNRADYSPAVDRYLQEKYSHAIDSIMDFSTVVEELENKEYYGSEALQEALESRGE